MTTSGLGHINFHADRALLDALKNFYCDVVGLRQGPRPPFKGFGYWLYAGDEPVVHLYEAEPDEIRPTGVTSTFDHIAFKCVNPEEVEARLRQFHVPHKTVEVPMTRQLQIFVSDPAGNKVELLFAVTPQGEHNSPDTPKELL